MRNTEEHYRVSALQAIECRILPQTNTKPRRVKAICGGGTITIPHCEETIADSCAKAAVHLAKKLGWLREGLVPYIGATKKGYVVVLGCPLADCRGWL